MNIQMVKSKELAKSLFFEPGCIHEITAPLLFILIGNYHGDYHMTRQKITSYYDLKISMTGAKLLLLP